jgi:glycosyltransferase involved in cell wall biosynthesis
MTVPSPLISIITPALNAGGTLSESLTSVTSQGLSDIEHLLIDARSSDQTLEIASGFPHLSVISEQDRGIYDGMNKGARLARGVWILFLQADDWLPEGTLAAYRGAIRANPDASMICGGAEAVRKSGGRYSTIWSVNDVARKRLTAENIALGEPMINARLFRRECFQKLGGFSLEYSLASDRDFLLRAADAGIRQEEVPSITYRYRWHDGSRTMTEGNALTNQLFIENLAIAKKHLSCSRSARRKVLRRWHTNLTVQAAMNALESPGMRGFLPAMKEGSAADVFWCPRFVTEVLRSLPGFLMRGCKTRSSLLLEKREKKSE